MFEDMKRKLEKCQEELDKETLTGQKVSEPRNVYTIFSKLGGFSKEEVENCIRSSSEKLGIETRSYILNSPKTIIEPYRNNIDIQNAVKIREIYNPGYEFPD